MWVKWPANFGRVVEDLSPDEGDQSKKSLYAIGFDDQQRNFNAPPKYYGIFWSADGPDPVNQVAIGLWDQFDDMKHVDHRDCEDNVDGEDTEEGECYHGFACFGFGSTAISLDVEQVEACQIRLIVQFHQNGMLRKALKLVNKYPDDLDDFMMEWRGNPRDGECLGRIHGMIGGPEPNPLAGKS